MFNTVSSNQLRLDVIFQAITKHLLKSYYATEKGYKYSLCAYPQAMKHTPTAPLHYMKMYN